MRSWPSAELRSKSPRGILSDSSPSLAAQRLPPSAEGGSAAAGTLVTQDLPSGLTCVQAVQKQGLISAVLTLSLENADEPESSYSHQERHTWLGVPKQPGDASEAGSGMDRTLLADVDSLTSCSERLDSSLAALCKKACSARLSASLVATPASGSLLSDEASSKFELRSGSGCRASTVVGFAAPVLGSPLPPLVAAASAARTMRTSTSPHISGEPKGSQTTAERHGERRLGGSIGTTAARLCERPRSVCANDRGAAVNNHG